MSSSELAVPNGVMLSDSVFCSIVPIIILSVIKSNISSRSPSPIREELDRLYMLYKLVISLRSITLDELRALVRWDRLVRSIILDELLDKILEPLRSVRCDRLVRLLASEELVK